MHAHNSTATTSQETQKERSPNRAPPISKKASPHLLAKGPAFFEIGGARMVRFSAFAFLGSLSLARSLPSCWLPLWSRRGPGRSLFVGCSRCSSFSSRVCVGWLPCRPLGLVRRLRRRALVGCCCVRPCRCSFLSKVRSWFLVVFPCASSFYRSLD